MKPDKKSTVPEIELSELEQAIANRERKCFEFEVLDYIGGTKKPLGKIRIRIATVAEQDDAIYQAHNYVQKVAKESNATYDPDLLENAKTAFILQKVCLRPNDNIPIFAQGAAWMLKNMSTDELAKILEYYNTVLREFSPFDLDLSYEKVMAIAEACAATAHTDAPNIILSKFTSDQKAELIIRISQKYAESQNKVKELEKEILGLKELLKDANQ